MCPLPVFTCPFLSEVTWKMVMMVAILNSEDKGSAIRMAEEQFGRIRES